jgi:hypothetical protein
VGCGAGVIDSAFVVLGAAGEGDGVQGVLDSLRGGAAGDCATGEFPVGLATPGAAGCLGTSLAAMKSVGLAAAFPGDEFSAMTYLSGGAATINAEHTWVRSRRYPVHLYRCCDYRLVRNADLGRTKTRKSPTFTRANFSYVRACSTRVARPARARAICAAAAE